MRHFPESPMSDTEASATASELWKVVETEEEKGLERYQYLKKINGSPEGWQLLPSPSLREMYKARFLGHDVFAKLYAPATGNFATDVYQATMELAKLNLNVAILPPLAVANRIVFFPRANFVRQVLVNTELQEQMDKVNASLKRFSGLEIIGKAELFSLDGKNYLVDVIDDSGPAIENYQTLRGFPL